MENLEIVLKLLQGIGEGLEILSYVTVQTQDGKDSIAAVGGWTQGCSSELAKALTGWPPYGAMTQALSFLLRKKPTDQIVGNGLAAVRLEEKVAAVSNAPAKLAELLCWIGVYAMEHIVFLRGVSKAKGDVVFVDLVTKDPLELLAFLGQKMEKEPLLPEENQTNQVFPAGILWTDVLTETNQTLPVATRVWGIQG